MRDITLEDTFYHHFTTRSFSTGVPTQLAGTPALSVLEENNVTPITAGVSLAVDRASVTGLNEATIVATAANGYESGKSYSIYISTGTVGGVSVVGEVVGHFTIAQSAAAVDLANGTDGLGAIKSDTAAVLTDTADIQPKLGTPAGADISADIAAVKGDTAAVLTDTGTAGVVIAAGQTVATVTTLTGHTAQTGDSFARLGAPAGASVSADVAAVKTDTAAVLVDTADIQPKLGTPAGADISADIAAVKGDTAAVLTDTNELQGDWADAGRLDAILDAVLAMLDDARGEPGQGAPPVNPDAMTKLDYLYKSWRNLKDNDGSTTQLYNDAGSVVDHKQTTSEAAGTVTKAEWVSGP